MDRHRGAVRVCLCAVEVRVTRHTFAHAPRMRNRPARIAIAVQVVVMLGLCFVLI